MTSSAFISTAGFAGVRTVGWLSFTGWNSSWLSWFFIFFWLFFAVFNSWFFWFHK
jgi:hypothetical protein